MPAGLPFRCVFSADLFPYCLFLVFLEMRNSNLTFKAAIEVQLDGTNGRIHTPHAYVYVAEPFPAPVTWCADNYRLPSPCSSVLEAACILLGPGCGG